MTTAGSPSTCNTRLSLSFLLSSYTHSKLLLPNKFCGPDRGEGFREAHFPSKCF